MPNNITKLNNLIFPEINFSEIKTSWVHKLNKDGLILELSRRNLISTGTVVELKNRLLNYLKRESLESDFLTINSLKFYGNPINIKEADMTDNKRPYFKPNKFSGSISDNVDSFLKQYNRAALINGWSDNDKTLYIAAFLEGSALTFFDNIQDNIANIKWIDLEKNLRKEFEPIAQTEMIRLILEKRKQLEDESTVSYINEAESLCRRIDKNMSQEEIVRNIMKGLKPNIARYIGIMNNNNLNELKENINHNCEISNTAALSEAIEPISSALDSSSTSNISPQKDLSKPINSKYDIGLYVNYVGSLPNEEKVSILNNVWTPDPNFIFPTQNHAKFKRQFQIKWLNTFNWLAYSKCKEGAFCKYCVLFLNQNQVGKGSHESLGGLVTKPYTNLKKALETFRCHSSYSYHRTAVLNADNIIAILNNKQDNVLVQLNNQLKEDILQNRNMLKPIIQTIRLCGRQQFGLRGHQDSGRISKKEPIQNDGNFRCLLRHRAQHGDNALKKYLETCSSNAMYTSPIIQNEIINTFTVR
ncbi:hypothetical protein QTP88_006480 [Uroleucon formosanum]